MRNGSASCGQLLQGVAGHAVDDPLFLQLRAQRFVEPNRRFVPIQHRPFEPTAPAFDGELGEREQ